MGSKFDWEKGWQLVWAPSLPCWDVQAGVRERRVEAEGGASRGWGSFEDTVEAVTALHSPISAALYQCVLIMNCLGCIQDFICCIERVYIMMSKSIADLRLLLRF